MEKSIINWVDEVWQPCSGCSKTCEGECNCFAKEGDRVIDRDKDTPHQLSIKAKDLYFSSQLLPYRMTTPRRILVNLGYELFDAPDKCIYDVFKIMVEASWHTFLVVTRDPDRMVKWITKHFYPLYNGVPEHIWFGVQVFDCSESNKIELLKRVGANKKFVLFEPLLGSVKNMSPSVLSGIDWVIVGGIVGSKPYLLHKDDALALRDICKKKNIPFFFDWWGDVGEHGNKVGCKKAGSLLEGHLHNEVPEDDYIRF